MASLARTVEERMECAWHSSLAVSSVPPKWMVLLMGNPIEMDDLGVPLFMETLIYSNHFLKWDEHPVVHGIAWV